MFWKSKKPEINLLELIPHRICEYETDEEERINVRVSRFKATWMAKAFIPRWKSPYVRTRLDAYGSFVWQQCDGARNVHEIAERLREHYGEDIEPVHERLKLFLQQLTLRGYIELRFMDGTVVDK
jgi:hypothetical protein